jgi:hypothetical protein
MNMETWGGGILIQYMNMEAWAGGNLIYEPRNMGRKYLDIKTWTQNQELTRHRDLETWVGGTLT